MSDTRKIGQFEFREKLGEGGSGRVDMGYDTVLDRQVAIKSLRPELLHDKAFVERFRTEAKNLARLSHPNITTLYALHEESGSLYMIMELVRGRTLETILLERSSPFSVEEALAIVAQAADGLDYAHEMGIVHRDIKPANLILTGTGLLKIMDFGIARAQGSQRMTRDGSVIGTVAYMSPEQCRGQEVDGRTDQYSLGIVLYEMLTGAVPFSAPSDFSLMQAQVSNTPEPPSRRISGIPPHVEKALMKALSKRREDRFVSLSALRNALGAPATRTEAVSIVQGVTRLVSMPIKPPSVPMMLAAASRATDSLGKSKFPFGGIAIGAAAALAVAAIAFFFWSAPTPPEPAIAGLAPGKIVSQVRSQEPNPYFVPTADQKASQEAPPGGAPKSGPGGHNPPPFQAAAEPHAVGPAAPAAEEPKKPVVETKSPTVDSTAAPRAPDPPSHAAPEEHKYSAKEVVAAFEAKDFASLRERAEPCAKDGNADCQFILGRLFEAGQGGAQNPTSAADWYRKAAESGHAKACYNLGVLYYRGDGVPRDNHIAAEWFTKAAYQNLAGAQIYLARLYENGEGVEKDLTLARKWFTEAAKSSDPQLAGLAQEGLDRLNGKRRR